MKVKHILQEAPIGDFEFIGDPSRNSSFRDRRDRLLVTNPRSVEHIKQKFSGVRQTVNMFFVNSPKANKHTEIGRVDENWIRKELGEDVYNTVMNSDTSNAVNIIFTNNKGVQRKPMTAWIIAHRMGHVFSRPSPNDNPKFTYAIDQMAYWSGEILQRYSRNYSNYRFHKFTQMWRADRKVQLALKNFYQDIGTFRSARDRKLRDFFEMYNELFAQYLTTGRIRFNEAPVYMKNIGSLGDDEFLRSEVNDLIETMGNYMESGFDDAMTWAVGKFWVM